jgi:hypothetical protein
LTLGRYAADVVHVVTIGIQTIMPDTATPQQQPPPQPDGGRYLDNAALIADAVAKQAPPPEGMGKLVDKTA